MKKECFGTCVDNPFETVEELSDIIENAHEITKRTFIKRCEVDSEIKAQMRRFPYDYVYYKNGNIYFYTWSVIEHFFK